MVHVKGLQIEAQKREGRIERMIEQAWEFKSTYPMFLQLLWDTQVGFWFSGIDDYEG